MGTAWLNEWIDDKGSSVLRRSVADVAKPSGGGNASAAELLQYLSGRADGPFTLLEIDGNYVVVRGNASPSIKVHGGTPTLSY